MESLNLTDKVTVITGGSSGIGKQTAMTFAKHGSDIAIVDINKEGQQVAEIIKGTYKRRAIFLLLR